MEKRAADPPQPERSGLVTSLFHDLRVCQNEVYPSLWYRNCELRAADGTSWVIVLTFSLRIVLHFKAEWKWSGMLVAGAIQRREVCRIENQQAMCSYAAHWLKEINTIDFLYT